MARAGRPGARRHCDRKRGQLDGRTTRGVHPRSEEAIRRAQAKPQRDASTPAVHRHPASPPRIRGKAAGSPVDVSARRRTAALVLPSEMLPGIPSPSAAALSPAPRDRGRRPLLPSFSPLKTGLARPEETPPLTIIRVDQSVCGLQRASVSEASRPRPSAGVSSRRPVDARGVHAGRDAERASLPHFPTVSSQDGLTLRTPPRGATPANCGEIGCRRLRRARAIRLSGCSWSAR